MRSLQREVPSTPGGRSRTDPTTPRANATPGRARASGSQPGPVATPTGSQATPKGRTPSAKSAASASSPRHAEAAPKTILADSILAGLNKDAEEQKKRLQETEAMAKRMADLFDNDDEVADSSTLQRISRELNFDFIKSKGELDDESQGGNSAISRRSTRLRSGSLKNQTLKSVPHTPRSNLTLPPRIPDASDRFFAEQRKLARKGIKTGDAENLLRAIRESESQSPVKADHPYPTPESDQFSDDGSGNDAGEDDARSPEMDLDVLAHRDLGGVLDVARELQESRRGSARHTAASLPLEWDGFWAKESAGPAAPVIQTADGSAVGKSNTSTFGLIFEGMGSAALASLSAAGVHALKLWKSEVSIPEEAFTGTGIKP